jgi:hypothetical protein
MSNCFIKIAMAVLRAKSATIRKFKKVNEGV